MKFSQRDLYRIVASALFFFGLSAAHACAQQLTVPIANPVSVSGLISTSGGTVVLDSAHGMNGQNACSVDVQGAPTFTGTLVVQASSGAWPVNVYPLNSSTPQAAITATGFYSFFVPPATKVQIVGPTGTGTAAILMECSYSVAQGGSGGFGGTPLDGSGYPYVDVALGSVTVNTPPPYPVWLTTGYGAMVMAGPSAEPAAVPVNNQYQAVIGANGALGVGCLSIGVGLNPSPAPNRASQFPSCDVMGYTFVRPGSGNGIDCTATFSTAGTQQCVGATNSTTEPYITDVDASMGTTQTAGTLQIGFQTSACSGALANPQDVAWQIPAGASNFTRSFTEPMQGGITASYVCVHMTGGTVSATVALHGYIAP